MFNKVHSAYKKVVNSLIQRGLTITSMESCTGGLISSLITDIDGSSGVFHHSFVTYDNDAKVEEGVPEGTICSYGVYSPQTAYAMASAGMAKANTNLGIGVTGSLNTVDPNNADSVSRVVYYCVILKRGNFTDMRTGDIRFQPGKSRPQMKLEVAEKVIFLVQDLLFSLDGD